MGGGRDKTAWPTTRDVVQYKQLQPRTGNRQRRFFGTFYCRLDNRYIGIEGVCFCCNTENKNLSTRKFSN